jgi:hypothetical protein
MKLSRRPQLGKPPNTEQGRSARNDGPPHNNREYRTIVASIQALTEEISASNTQTDAYQRKNLFWNKLTSGAVAVYTILTLVIVIISRCSLNETRESYSAVQRAFVVVSGMKQEVNHDPNGKPISYSFAPVIRNSGNTPTKDLEFIAISPLDEITGRGYDANAPLPPDPAEQFDNSVFHHDKGKYVLGPQDALPPLIEPFPIDSSTFADIIGGRMGRFFYGAIRYRDIFEHSPPHITKYCFTINNFKTGPGGFLMSTREITAPSVTPIYAMRNNWNCADTECDEPSDN